jgi:hypothetical protein
MLCRCYPSVMALTDTAHISLDALWKYRAEKMLLTPDQMNSLLPLRRVSLDASYLSDLQQY